jgi:hypothetical protein
MVLIFKLEINQSAGTEPSRYGFINILVKLRHNINAADFLNKKQVPAIGSENAGTLRKQDEKPVYLISVIFLTLLKSPAVIL